MGGEPTPKLVTSFRGGEVEANFQSLPGDAFLLARVLEDRTAAPWIRLLDEESANLAELETFIEIPVKLQVETHFSQETYDVVPV